MLRYIAYTRAPLKRAERAEARRRDILSHGDEKQTEFLDFVLSQYIAEGEDELDAEKLPDLLTLKYGTPADALRRLGKAEDVRRAFRELQQQLYKRD